MNGAQNELLAKAAQLCSQCEGLDVCEEYLTIADTVAELRAAIARVGKERAAREAIEARKAKDGEIPFAGDVNVGHPF